jgi:hypothetical protein
MHEENNQNTIKLKDIREQMEHVMSAASSGPLPLLQLMGVALMAAATQIIEREQLAEITDRVELNKDMPKGIDRDLYFETTRKMLNDMIGYIEG